MYIYIYIYIYILIGTYGCTQTNYTKTCNSKKTCKD